MTRGPRGLDASDEFLDYMAELRETWPEPDDESDDKDAPLGETRETTAETQKLNMSKANSDAETDGAIENNSMGRRAFLQATGAAAVTVATTGIASASHGKLNYGSEKIPDPYLEADLTVATHNRAEMSEEVEYIPDSGDDATDAVSLAEYGGELAPRPDTDTTTAHNPVTLRADRIDAEEYKAFPRGETYDESGDGEANTDLDAIDATHWSTDTSGSAGSLTVENVDAPSGGPALRMAASSQGSGDVALARFTDVSITDGELRKVLQLGTTVDALPSGTSITIRVEDSTGATVSTTIDPSADSSTNSVISTTTHTGDVYQVQLGDLTSSMDDIEALEVELADGNPDITFFAINVERSSKWEFGSEEFVNSDDELETRTRTSPRGEYSITDLDTLGDSFSSATIKDLKAAIRMESSGIKAEDMVVYEFSDLDHPSYSRKMRLLVNFEPPTAYALDYANMVAKDESVLWSEQYGTVEVTTGESDPLALSDVSDVSMTDRTSVVGDKGNTYELTSTPSAGSVTAAHYELRVDDADESEMLSSGAAGPAAGDGGGFFSGVKGTFAGIGLGIAAFVAMLRSRLTGS